MTVPEETKTAVERIHDAYVALCETKPYYKIRVSEVVKQAGINRTTFYRHYLGMPDLILAMYRRYMRGFLAVPQGMTVASAADLEAYSYEVWNRLTAHREELLKILDMPGILRMMVVSGRALQNKQTRLAKKAKLSDPAIFRNIRYTPYLFVFQLFITTKGENILIPQLSVQQKQFDPALSVPENLSHYMEAQLGGNSDFHYALFGAYIKLTTANDEDALTVTELLETAGISRTQFYLYYKNMEDFRRRFYYTCFEMAIEIMLHICRTPEPLSETEASTLRATIFEAYNNKAIHRLLSTGKLVEYGSYILAHIYLRYHELLEQDYGPLNETQQQTLVYYIGVMCTLALWYYIHKIDYAEYRKSVLDVKVVMCKALGIEP